MAPPTLTLRIGENSALTLPADLSREWNVKAGEAFQLVRLQNGLLVLVPLSAVDQNGNEVARLMQAKDINLEEMFTALETARAQMWQERHA